MEGGYTVRKWQEILYYFVMTAFLGYVYEYLLINYYYGIEFVNAGPFHLPLLLIYGLGGTMIIVLLKDFRKKKITLFDVKITPLLTALIILFVVCAVEYAGHYAVETLSGVKPWDYSEKFLNLNGRICLEDSIRFVILGMVGIYALVPAAERLFSKLTRSQNTIICGALATAMLIDLCLWLV